MSDFLIPWTSDVLDDISCFYQKAEGNAELAEMTVRLEQTALTEARDNIAQSGIFRRREGARPDQQGRYAPGDLQPLGAANFDVLPMSDGGLCKESVIAHLGARCLASLDSDVKAKTITVAFTDQVVRVKACALFALINRIEKLDGAINTYGTFEMTLKFPQLGSDRGFTLLNFILLRAYPWITSIHVEKENRMTEEGLSALTARRTAENRDESAGKADASGKGPQTVYPPVSPAPAAHVEEKLGFFQRLFGKSRTRKGSR